VLCLFVIGGDTDMKEIHDILLEFARRVNSVMKYHFKKMVVYGSYARGDYTEGSDIDVMIFTELKEAEISKIENTIYDISFDIQMEYGVDISVIIKNENDFNYWLGTLPFYNNVQREGVVIHGW